MHVLLILILFGDPSGAEAAKAIAGELDALGGTSVHVVIGAAAAAELAKKGVKEADLVGSQVIANHLTGADPDLVVIRVDQRSEGGDQIIESRVWFDGRSDSHVAIAGHGGDPIPSALSCIIQVLGPRLPLAPGQPANLSGGHLAQQAEKGEWQELYDSLHSLAGKDPRQCYYLVLAEVRLGQVEEARKDLEAMRAAHGTHFLVKAAASLLPPVEPPPKPAGAPPADLSAPSAPPAPPATPSPPGAPAPAAPPAPPGPAGPPGPGNVLR